tara:strand:- start:149 stop:817 length:669 start_codon:yes stop_codon:yes gene_type:complete
VVHSFEELVSTPLDSGVNALCWPRVLGGDFGEVVERLNFEKGITPVDEDRLRALSLSEAGQLAREVLLQDLERLRSHDLLPSLDGIHGYTNEIETDPMRTDVQSFHVDSATAEADTWLCTYHGPPSEGLRNDGAIRRADIPEIRANLLKLYEGPDDEGFLEFLGDHFYDLHYDPLPEAKPFSFGVGHLWRIATEYPGSPVPPCIHRAPDTIEGAGPRLLLIS